MGPGDVVGAELTASPLIGRPVLNPDRCIRLRLPSAECDYCAGACPSEAIGGGRPDDNLTNCTGCGLCVAACPTGAWRASGLDTAGVLSSLSGVKQARVAIFCRNGRKALPANGERIVVLPCAASVTPSILVGSVLMGAREIQIKTGACPGCKTEAGRLQADRSISVAQKLLAALGKGGIEINLEVALSEALKSRRAVFASVFSRGITVAHGLLDSKLNRLARACGSYDKPRAGEGGHGWRLDLVRLVAGLPMRGGPFAMNGWPVLGRVEVDADACDHCGGCARVCPLGALRIDESAGGEMKLTFHAARCIGCGICAKVCRCEALHVAKEARAADLSCRNREVIAKRSYESCRMCTTGRAVREGYCPSCFSRSKIELDFQQVGRGKKPNVDLSAQ